MWLGMGVRHDGEAKPAVRSNRHRHAFQLSRSHDAKYGMSSRVLDTVEAARVRKRRRAGWHRAAIIGAGDSGVARLGQSLSSGAVGPYTRVTA